MKREIAELRDTVNYKMNQIEQRGGGGSCCSVLFILAFLFIIVFILTTPEQSHRERLSHFKQ